MSETQWDQASLGVKQSGIGLCCASDIADAAYLASRADAFEDCKGLDRLHVWDDGGRGAGDIGDVDVLGEWLLDATRRYDAKVPVSSRVRDKRGVDIGRQGLLVGKLQKLKWDAMYEEANEVGRARLNGTSAPHAGAWLDAPPNRALDFKLTNAEIKSRVGRRLGVQLCEECPCPFCFGVVDKWGINPESCTAGGKTRWVIIFCGIICTDMAGGQVQFQFWRQLVSSRSWVWARGVGRVGLTGRVR